MHARVGLPARIRPVHTSTERAALFVSVMCPPVMKRDGIILNRNGTEQILKPDKEVMLAITSIMGPRPETGRREQVREPNRLSRALDWINVQEEITMGKNAAHALC